MHGHKKRPRIIGKTLEKEKNFMVKKIEFYRFFNKKKVLVTGHTGFKGSWLTVWLNKLGSNVVGISDEKVKKDSFLNNKQVKKKMKSYIADINNFESLKRILKKEKPDIIFHLAAQAIVSESFRQPLKTINTNALGSINLLHAASFSKKKIICIMITSDKCYLNLEKKSGYNEKDILGGDDIYSGSKAAAEILLRSYYFSFLKKNKKLLFCTARAGNVIGGGDWSKNRLIPDIIKSFSKNKKLLIKNPNSVRPWQHVLEPLYGYMLLAKKINNNPSLSGQSFNFGPKSNKDYKVKDLVLELGKLFKKKNFFSIVNKKKFEETKHLKLISKKANSILKWKTILKMNEVIYLIYRWYFKNLSDKKNSYKITLDQISEYEIKRLN